MLTSCLNQTNNNFEIIFFDDKSTDNSIEIAKSFKKFSKMKNNFKIFSRQTSKSKHNCYNQISAITYALKHCKGSYISLLDADDLFDKDKIKNLHKLIKKKKYKIFYNSYFILKNEKLINNIRHYKSRKFFWPVFPPTSCVTIEAKLFKILLKKISFKRYPTCWLDFRLATYVSKKLKNEVYYSKKKMTIYRINTTGNDNIYNNFFSFFFWKRKIQALIINNIFNV